MINKIIEEAMTNMIRRIEVLENKILVNSTPTSKGFFNPSPNKPGLATSGQVRYIRALGGDTWTEMTKDEAGKEIDRLLVKKSKKEIEKTEEVKEPAEVDTDEVGLDSEGLM